VVKGQRGAETQREREGTGGKERESDRGRERGREGGRE